jgi:hypothetical protein
MQGMYQNDFLGLTFTNVEINGKVMGPPITGEYVVQQGYQIDLARSKWVDLGAIALMCLGYRLIFFLVIKFTEDVQPQVRRVVVAASCRTFSHQQQLNPLQQEQMASVPATSVAPSPANELLPLAQNRHFWAATPSPQNQAAPPSSMATRTTGKP